MARIIEAVASRLGIPVEELEREAIELWIKRKLALIDAEIAEILARYRVSTAEELERGISSGNIPEHPAWEDLIVLERLIEERKKLSDALRIRG